MVREEPSVSKFTIVNFPLQGLAVFPKLKVGHSGKQNIVQEEK